jgi:dolichol kinase
MVLDGLFVVAMLVVAALDGYQAITGRRLSKRPSRRSDEQMRKQSAIAAVVLTVLAVVLTGSMVLSR